MIDDESTTDSRLPGTPVLTIVRDELAQALHDLEHGPTEVDSPSEPCWTAWRVEADALMPVVRQWFARVWVEGARDGSRGILPARRVDARNPYQRKRSSTTASGVNAGQEASPGGADEAPDKAKGSALTEPCSTGDDGIGAWTSPRPHCPCFLHYSPPRKWWRMACACECDHEWGA